jgi:hypothetical protein
MLWIYLPFLLMNFMFDVFSKKTRQKELFMGENRGYPYHFASWAIDAGADIVRRYSPR